jgi:hypothetical protein
MTISVTVNGRDGVVGLASLNVERVRFDFDRGELSWEGMFDEGASKAE